MADPINIALDGLAPPFTPINAASAGMSPAVGDAGSIGDVTLTTCAGSAVGDAVGVGSIGDVTLTTCAGSAVGDAVDAIATGSIGSIVVVSITGSAQSAGTGTLVPSPVIYSGGDTFRGGDGIPQKTNRKQNRKQIELEEEEETDRTSWRLKWRTTARDEYVKLLRQRRAA